PHVTEVKKNGTLVTLRASEENGTLESILAFLKEEQIPYNNIHSEMPTLNDVFLEITGKELRD
ncbi:ATP-binding protein DrrA1-3 family domain-containing protein, partial [Proteiniclasticum ruminis]